MECKVMTFNLKNDHQQLKRAKAICQMIREEDADLVGTQECSWELLQYFQKYLFHYIILKSSRGKKHEDDNVILVRKNRFQILRYGVYSLSPTPNIPYTKNFTSIQARTLSFVQVRDSETRFTFYNTHLDFLLPQARRYQLQVIQNIIPKGLNILVGDFNFYDNSFLRNFRKKRGLKEAFSKEIGSSFQIMPWRKPIDHIFIPMESKVLEVYKRSNVQNGMKLSDHSPIVVKIQI